MAKKKPRIRFNPRVGMRYLIRVIETGEEIICSTLCARDKDQKPYRTPAGTPAGEEFFKVKIGSKRKKSGFTYITFMNSVTRVPTISKCGKYEFTGARPNGEALIPNTIDETTHEAETTPEPVAETPEPETPESPAEVEATAEVERNDFSNPGAVAEMMQKKKK